MWAVDITGIPMRRGSFYLIVSIDWASRRSLAWALANTLTTDCALDAVCDTIYRHACREIFNSKQACPFTPYHDPFRG